MVGRWVKHRIWILKSDYNTYLEDDAKVSLLWKLLDGQIWCGQVHKLCVTAVDHCCLNLSVDSFTSFKEA